MTQASTSRSSLYRRSFGPEAFNDHDGTKIRFLRALEDMRERAFTLSNETARDLPELTQHDGSHMTALWEVADLIAGPEITLNPAEAFVLGASILVHDLAMSNAAYHVSGAAIRERREWPDALAHELRKEYNRSPYTSELASPPADIAQRAEKVLLRSLHAELAEQLPLGSWKALDSSIVNLIVDPELRSAYGRLIGQVAASHHWNHDELVTRLASPVGAPGFAPVEWKVDTLLIACLLRTADSAHLDSTRAPDLLAAVRNLPTSSKEHWIFQSRFQRPYLNNGRLVFTAPDGFSQEEIGAWWLGYDALRVVDNELRSTDSILSENGRSVFAARGVANVESPKELSQMVLCRGWAPVAAQVHVGDVAGLVRRLGGAELYGQDWSIGLRELITNASDATKARMALSSYKGGHQFLGRVSVILKEDGSSYWLSCTDNGIGMSPAVLGGKLLDFGTSSWLSQEVVRENPGLLASSFEPTGRFGIGFFSVFMMGKRVRVTSRAIAGGPADTWVLEFGEGIEGRPIIRRATHAEQLDEPGTEVSVCLEEPLVQKIDGKPALRIRDLRMAKTIFSGYLSLSDLVRYLIPAPEVDVWVSDGADPRRIMEKDDWMTLDGKDFLMRVFGVPLELPDQGYEEYEEEYEEEEEEEEEETEGRIKDYRISPFEEARKIAREVANELSFVDDENGVHVGRIALLDPHTLSESYMMNETCLITAGPTRTRSTQESIAGLLIGKPARAARDAARPLAAREQYTAWADLQVGNLSARDDAYGEWCANAAETLCAFGADVRPLRIWRVENDWVDWASLVQWISQRKKFRAVDYSQSSTFLGDKEVQLDGVENVVYYVNERSSRGSFSRYWSEDLSMERTLIDELYEAIENAWEVEIPFVSPRKERKFYRNGIVGLFRGEKVYGSGLQFQRSALG
ncbi:ATP-binding protein [Streptomyces sp. NPDC058221]|uniref:HD domain-containing protein n=1 Tax=Streptomyces sp. NPDC058221 TaxID=3346388 RepID=UPI0036EC278D